MRAIMLLLFTGHVKRAVYLHPKPLSTEVERGFRLAFGPLLRGYFGQLHNPETRRESKLAVESTPDFVYSKAP